MTIHPYRAQLPRLLTAIMILMLFAPAVRAGGESAPSRPANPLDRAAQTSDGRLSYKIEQLPGGTIAVFDGWQVVPVSAGDNTFMFDTTPPGSSRDFVLRVCIVTPSAQELARVFELAPQVVRQFLVQISPTFRQSAEAQRTRLGSDDAMVEEYCGSLMEHAITARVLYVRRDDIAIAVMGLGTEAGMRQYGSAIEVMAKSITFRPSPLEPQLAGAWVLENNVRVDSGAIGRAGDVLNVSTSRTITIDAQRGIFSDSAGTVAVGADVTGHLQDGSRGRVIKRGNILTFHYDNGQTWSATYSLEGGALKLNGQIFLRQ
jgi:hypothetical protein